MVSLSISQQFIRFAGVGGVATVVYFGSAFFFSALMALPAVVASVLAYSIAAAFGFIGHRKFTFHSDRKVRSEAVRFMVATGLGFSLATIIPAIVTGYFDYVPVISFTLVLLIVPILSFIVMRHYVFAET